MRSNLRVELRYPPVHPPSTDAASLARDDSVIRGLFLFEYPVALAHWLTTQTKLAG